MSSLGARLLWVDDQVEVAQTLASLLDPLHPRVRFVSDIEIAEKALQAEYYDAAVVDLRMPPGDWGGLQLLERLRAQGVMTPCVVLSGEGGQTETIQALRSGAVDYIEKSRSKEELLARIRGVLARAETEAESELTSVLPTPLAVAYGRLKARAEPVERLRAVIAATEVLARFVGIVALAESRGLKVPFAQVGSPSMGWWLQTCSERAKVQDTPTLAELLPCMDQTAAKAAVRRRNDLAHGGDASSEVATEWLRDLEPALFQSLRCVARRMRSRLALALGMRFDGSGFEIDVCDVRGDSTALPRRTAVSTVPLRSGRVYIERPRADWCELWPWMVLRPARDPATWQVLVFDGVAHSGSRPDPATKLRYVDVWTGERVVGPGSVADLSQAVDLT